MNKERQILILEDNFLDSELIQRELTKAGYRFTARWAKDKEDFVHALDTFLPDFILVDYSLPGFDGMSALALARGRFRDTPVILVSGAVGEETAIEALKAGATDYVFKQRLSRLGPVVRRALLESEQLAEKKRAEEALARAKEQLEEKVRERTAELASAIGTLREEVAQRRRAEEDLQRVNGQLRAASAQLNVAEQRERKRLAQVLHDGLQQNIAAAKFRLGFLERIGGPEVLKAVAEVNEILSESMEMSRSLTADLSPPVLREEGLVPALEWLAGLMRARQGLVVELVARDPVDHAAEDVCILLFQATRELLFNVLKHSGVRAARVQVERGEREARITVSDDGDGFDPAILLDGAGGNTGFGLFSIRERLNLLGGGMQVESAPGQGSRFTLKVPLRSPAA